MLIMNRPSTSNAVLTLAFAFFLSSVSLAQSESTVYEGSSFDSIKIGKSTDADVMGAYGSEFKLIKHGEYSYEMTYKKLGMSFYYCHADPRKEIFTVVLEQPARVATMKGIRLGVSTMGDVFQTYGKPDITSAGYEYEGIYFDVKEDDNDKSDDDASKGSNVAQKAATPKPDDTQSAPLAQLKLTNSILRAEVNVTASTTVKNDDDEPDDKKRKEDEEKFLQKQMKDVAGKVVRRIELIEPELRQCETRFRANR